MPKTAALIKVFEPMMPWSEPIRGLAFEKTGVVHSALVLTAVEGFSDSPRPSGPSLLAATVPNGSVQVGWRSGGAWSVSENGVPGSAGWILKIDVHQH